tara:strand:+ start:503 stop:1696 length:1194 start_codon:yes stop_codon:yes gene_type:complete
MVTLSSWGLPKDVIYCKKCVISNQRPGTVSEFKNKITKNTKDRKSTIGFENGVCASCRYHEYKYNVVDWNKREQELLKLLDRYRKKNGDYDVIVPGSGGKDSAYVSHVLKNKYGMNPLTVTWSPHSYTDIGWKNFISWIESGHDNILITPDRSVHKKLTSLSFKNLLHPFQPFMIGQKYVGPRIARDRGINLVFYGENQAEGGSNLDWDQKTMPNSFYSGNEKELRIGGYDIKELSEIGIEKKDLNLYKPISNLSNNLEVHFMSYYRKWIPQENYYYAVDNCGFRDNSVRSEGSYTTMASLDDKIDGFHYYTTFIKYGIGRASYDAAQEIRNGHITREEGVSLVKKFDGEFPSKYYEHFLNYIDICDDEFKDLINKGRSEHIWDKINGEWKLKSQVF